MAKLGGGSLACSILGLGLIIPRSLFSLKLINIPAMTLYEMTPLLGFLMLGGVALGSVGLILGIVGLRKDEKKAFCSVGIMLGCITFALLIVNIAFPIAFPI